MGEIGGKVGFDIEVREPVRSTGFMVREVWVKFPFNGHRGVVQPGDRMYSCVAEVPWRRDRKEGIVQSHVSLVGRGVESVLKLRGVTQTPGIV